MTGKAPASGATGVAVNTQRDRHLQRGGAGRARSASCSRTARTTVPSLGVLQRLHFVVTLTRARPGLLHDLHGDPERRQGPGGQHDGLDLLVVHHGGGRHDATDGDCAEPRLGATGVAVASNVTAPSARRCRPARSASCSRTAGRPSPRRCPTSPTRRDADPDAALAYATTYTATLSGAEDLAGNTMSSVSWSFTTAAGRNHTDGD